MTRGDIQYSDPFTLSIRSVRSDLAIVTSLPVGEGEPLIEGQLVLEVNGRPAVVLEGDLPVYRDLQPGDTGTDVEQLQSALVRLGHLDGPAGGVFDAGTELALTRLYESLGYTPPQSSEEQLAELQSAIERRDLAAVALKGAELELFFASLGTPEDELVVLELALESAQADEARAKNQRALSLAAADIAIVEAQGLVKDADFAMQEAQAALSAARESPAGGAPLNADINVLEQAVLVAGRNLDLARLREWQAVENRRATDEDTASAVELAGGAVGVAFAALNEARAPSDLTLLEQSLEARTDELEAAQSEVDELEARTGITASRFEILFVPQLPRRIDAISPQLGGAFEGDLLTASSESLVLQGTVRAEDRQLLEAGMSVTFGSPATAGEFDGTIESLASEPGSDGAAPGDFAFTVRPTQPVGAQLVGANVRVEIPIESTDGEVLAVPFAALAANASGEARVAVIRPDGGDPESVRVAVGLAADGLVEVSPVEGALEAGDLVVVGASPTLGES